MEIQQGTRMQRLGLNFVLNDRDLCFVLSHLVGGGVTAAMSWGVRRRGEEVVATLLGYAPFRIT